jgi:phosphotransferase system enzyme I (PtsI)
VLSEEESVQHVQRLEQAIIQTRHELLEVQRKVSEAMRAEDAQIFDAHLLMLEDPVLMDEIMRLIRDERVNSEAAVKQATDKYMGALEALDDDYLRERAADLRDVASRLLNHLLGRSGHGGVPQLFEPTIVISRDLAPSTTAQLDKKLVLGFGTDIGSPTSHTAILARSLQIPAVVGLHDASHLLHTGESALLDGYNGVIVINPTDATLFEYGQLVRKHVTLEDKLRSIAAEPAITLDGHRIVLSANIEQTADAEQVTQFGAEGVGLFRTEFLFINREEMPSEEVQAQAYRQVAAALKPAPVIIRTLDIGGDKFVTSVAVPQEMNPFLGWRAIRYCLQEKDLFRAQLRAILRASAEGNVKLMYPMISGLQELEEANALLAQCRQELRTEGVPFDEAMEVGAMIEIPSAALCADSLARRVDFFSIGTNDLIQYTLAVDRLNERIAHLYQPTHPAILRLIQATVKAGSGEGAWVGVCGEMAGDPALVPLLLGLGATELSAAPPLVPQVKFLIRRLRMDEARELAEFALNCESGAEILARCQALARQVAPSLFDIESGP